MGAVLAHVNHADTATLSTTTSGSMLRPLSELQTKWARGLCRGPANGTSGDPATLVIRADLGSSKIIHSVGVVGLNGVTGTTMSVTLSASSFGATDAGSGGNDWDPAYGEDYGQGLFITPDAGHWTARYVQISLEVYGRASGQRYVDARRLLIMAGGSYSDGVDFDWSMLPVDLGQAITTPRGGVFVSPQAKHRAFSFGISGMTLREARIATRAYDNYDSLEHVLASAGRTTEIVAIPRHTAEDEEMFTQAIYGRLVEWSPIVHTGGDTYACDSIVVHETPYPAL